MSEEGPLSSTSSSSSSDSEAESESKTVSASVLATISAKAIYQLIAVVDKIDSPVVELWEDPKVKLDDRFPYEAQEAGRQVEIDHLARFDAIEDVVPLETDKIEDTRWVEEWRGDAVRSRLCVRSCQSKHQYPS